MEFLAPTSWADALAARSEHPGAVPIAGGTDLMVELNFDRSRPAALDGAEAGIRTLTPLRAAEFKSAASAVPPRRRGGP